MLLKPEGTCCSGLKTVVRTGPECLCEAFKNSASLGVTLDLSKAASLPSVCKVAAPPSARCGLSVPASPPATAPGRKREYWKGREFGSIKHGNGPSMKKWVNREEIKTDRPILPKDRSIHEDLRHRPTSQEFWPKTKKDGGIDRSYPRIDRSPLADSPRISIFFFLPEDRSIPACRAPYNHTQFILQLFEFFVLMKLDTLTVRCLFKFPREH